MNLYEDIPVDQLGRQAHGHIIAGDKAKDKADQQYLAAGLYLAAAKVRVQRTKGMTWPLFLAQNCNVGKTRANEIIMIADGRTTLAEVRQGKAERQAKTAARRKAADVAATGVQSSEKEQQNQGPTSGTDAVEEARATSNPRNEALARITARIKRLDLADLDTLERYLSLQFGE